MKPQDVALLLQIISWKNRKWSQRELAESLFISVSEINHGLKRLAAAKLFNPISKKALLRSAEEFLLHGVKYLYPAEFGAVSIGVPTAHSAAPLVDEFVFGESDNLVWADENGNVRGQSIKPLYPTLPQAARNDTELHQLLALLDGVRSGRARERVRAEEELSARLQH